MDHNERLDLLYGMRPSSTNWDNLFNDDIIEDVYDGSPEKIFICRTCEKYFTFEHNLTRHLKSSFHKRMVDDLNDEFDEGYYFYCDVCKKWFISQAMLTKHEKTPTHIKKLAKKIKRDLKKQI